MGPAKHTPGPWCLLTANFSPRIYIMRAGYGPDDAAIADVRDRYDARLIVSAPDLLEALEKIAALDQRSGASLRDRAASEIAREAIFKAEIK